MKLTSEKQVSHIFLFCFEVYRIFTKLGMSSIYNRKWRQLFCGDFDLFFCFQLLNSFILLSGAIILNRKTADITENL